MKGFHKPRVGVGVRDDPRKVRFCKMPTGNCKLVGADALIRPSKGGFCTN